MNALATCIQGLEEATLQELETHLHLPGRVSTPGVILFSPSTPESLSLFTYTSRSILGAGELLNHFTFTTLEDLTTRIKQTSSTIIQGTFAVRCQRTGSHDFTSQDAEKILGEHLHLTYHLSVNLTSPQYLIAILIRNNQCYVFLDYAGFNLHKRDYRIKAHPKSIPPTLAYCLLALSAWKPSQSLLDPFSRSGELCVEAALTALGIPAGSHQEHKFQFTRFLSFTPPWHKSVQKKLSVFCVDPLYANLRDCQINAKLAGVEKAITFSRTDLDWLDTKFPEHSIDKIITHPPEHSGALTEKKAQELSNQLFYQAAYLLNDKGTITILTKKPEFFQKIAAAYTFTLIKAYTLTSQGSKILIFKKTP